MPRSPKRLLKSAALRLPYLGRMVAERDEFRAALAESRDAAHALEAERQALASELERQRTWVAPGHFYSPIPSPREIEARADEIWPRPHPPRALPAIDLREDAQLRLLSELAAYYPDQPFSARERDGLRYHFENDQFSYSDAILLHCLLRHLRPTRLCEVGSGYSSAVALDTNELFLGGALSCAFVEPHPARLRALLKDGERVRLYEQAVQDVDPSLFSELEAGDFLFIDSTHVSKAGGDVNHLVFEILPRLAAGVLVHFHDIFYPFVYPREWEAEGRAWNEAYLLRAFLQYNRAFEILLFPSFLQHFHADWFSREMPLTMRRTGASLWLRKL